jgi:hypothetical protein
MGCANHTAHANCGSGLLSQPSKSKRKTEGTAYTIPHGTVTLHARPSARSSSGHVTHNLKEPDRCIRVFKERGPSLSPREGTCERHWPPHELMLLS